MKRYAVFPYDPETGAILKRLDASEPELRWLPEPFVVSSDPAALSWHDGTHYVADGALAARPVMPLAVDRYGITADGVDTATISGIPVGTTVTCQGVPDQVVADGVLEFSAEVADAYLLQLRLFPYVDATVAIAAGTRVALDQAPAAGAAASAVAALHQVVPLDAAPVAAESNDLLPSVPQEIALDDGAVAVVGEEVLPA